MFRDAIYSQWHRLFSRPKRYLLLLAMVATLVAIGEIAILKPQYIIVDKKFEPNYEKCPKIETKQLNNSSNDDRIKVAVCIIATGIYANYIPVVINSGRKYLLATSPLKRAYNVTYLIFTSEPDLVNAELDDTSGIRLIFKPYHGWPWDALYKYATYLNYSSTLQEFDFIFAMDADMRFVDEVGGEILGDLVGAAHAEYYETSNTNIFPYERRPELCAAIPYGIGKHYFQSTIFGGRTKNFLQMMCYLHQCFESDFDPENGRNLLARVEDESYLNRYFIDHPPTIILNPAYLWPVNFNKPPFTARISQIKKDTKALHVSKKMPERLDTLSSLVGA